MVKIAIAPNSFRGSLNAFEVAEAISTGFKRAIPEVEVVVLPAGQATNSRCCL